MKTIVFALAALLATSGIASAGTLHWVQGWDILDEPINLKTSTIVWSVVKAKKELKITYTINGATENMLYQVGLHIFGSCTRKIPTFGQFPPGTCGTITRHNVTETVRAVEAGVVTTDIHGDGVFEVVIGPIAAGTYKVEFDTRDGAGCDLSGGDADTCAVIFQSGKKFGKTTTITVP
jgi:hypothetical protein